MAINLDHFKLAEDQNLFYRRVGMPAVDDFFNRGAIAGTQKYGTEAYFLRGAEWATGGAPYKMTADMSRLNPVENPLYGDIGVNKYLTKEGAFPLGKSAMASGQYPRLTPNKNPSFIDTINPANRSGIKIEDTRTGEVFYDRTKPITKTPIGTTLKNINAESRIFENAAFPYAKKALTVGGKALAVVGGALEVANVPDRVKGYYMNALKNDPNWRPDASDKFGMSLFAGLEASANFATLGLYDQKERIYNDMSSGAGYGKGYYGTMVPRSGMTSVHSNPESRYERVGISFDHVYPQAPR